jgi:NADH-quinone oxidoreductase subunit L
MLTILFNLVLLLPLMSFITLVTAGRLIGTYGSIFFSCANIFVALFCSICLLLCSSFHYSFFVDLWKWLLITDFDISFSLRYDSLTCVMFIVVTIVSSCVHLYSSAYMYTDPYLSRFMSYLSLFTFFMLLLVSSSNLLVLFLGW